MNLSLAASDYRRKYTATTIRRNMNPRTTRKMPQQIIGRFGAQRQSANEIVADGSMYAVKIFLGFIKD